MISRVPQPALGTATAGSNVTWTANTSGLSLDARGYAGTGTTFGGTNISASLTLNSNGLQLSLSGNSTAAGGVSAGTASASLGTVVFSNSNGVSFGVNGQTVTASHNGLTSQSNQALSAGNGSFTFQTATFADSNGVSFSTGTQGIYATVKTDYLTSQSNQAFSAQGGSSAFQTLGFSNANGVTFTNTNGSVGLTHDLQYTSATSVITSNALHSSASRVMNFVAATNNTGGGTASLSSNVSLSNANGLTFYTSAGNAIVGSYTVPSTAGLISAINVSAGTTSTNAGAFTLSNANGVSFGLDGRTITASVATTYRASNDAVGLNTALTAGPLAWTVNSSGISINAASAAGTSSGFAGNSISGSITHDTAGINISLAHPAWLTTAMASNAATISNVRVSAGTTSNLLSAITFANGNGISFGLDASTITASHNALTTARASNDAIGLNTAQTNVTWTVNSSGLSLDAGGYAGTGFTSATTAGTAVVGTNNTAGLSLGVPAFLTTAMASNRGSDFVQANAVFNGTNASGTIASNAVSVSVAAQSVQTQNLHNVTLSGNTAGVMAQVSSGTLTLAGGNNITLSQNGNAITISGANVGGVQTAISGIVVSDATYTSGTVSFSNAGNITIGSSVDGATQYIRLSGNPAQTNQSAIRAFGVSNTGATAGNTGVSTGVDWVLAGSNSITLSQSTVGGGPNTVWIQHPAWLTTAMASNRGSDFVQATAAFAGTNASGTIASNGISVSVGNYITTARASNDAVGLNTAQTNVTWTVNSAGLSLNAAGYAGTGFTSTTTAGTAIVGTNNTAGLSIGVPAFLTTAMQSNAVTLSNIRVSGGTTSNLLSAITFGDGNGISFGLNASTLTASHNGLTSQSNQNVTAANGGFAFQTLSFSNVNGISFGTSAGSAITASHNALTTARASNDAVGLNTAQTNVTWTVNSAGLSLNAAGYAGTGTSNTGAASFTLNSNGLQFNGTNLAGVGTTFNGTNASGSMTLNTAGLRLDVSVNAGGGGAAISAGANSQSTGTVNFANSNGITFGLSNNGTMTASHNGLTTARASNDAIGLNTAGSNVTWTVNSSGLSFDARGYAGTNTTFAGANISASMTLNSNGLNLSASVAAPGAAAENNWVHLLGANTSGNTTASGSTLGWSGINLTLSGTNDSRLAISAPATSSLTGTGALNISANGSTISLGVGPMTAYAVGNTVSSSSGTWDARSLSFAGAGNVSVGVSNGSVLVYGDNAAIKSYFRYLENWAGMVTGAAAITQTSGSSVFVQPFWLPYPVSASYLRMLASFNDNAAGTGGTTSANTSFSVERYTTVAAVVYTQGVGAQSLSLRSIYSTSAGITGRTIYTAGAQGSQYTMTLQKTYPATGAADNVYTTSYAVSSGSIVLSSQSNTLFTGPRFLDVPFGTSLGVGPYWLGIGASTSSASNSSNISAFGTAAMGLSLAGVSQSNVSVGILGAVTSASAHQLARGLGAFTTNDRIISTASIGLGQISQMVSCRQLPFELIREA